jgi:hypothetical protein
MCDREECWSGDASVRRMEDRSRTPERPLSARQADDEIINDCIAHAVDWRDRARRAERQRDELLALVEKKIAERDRDRDATAAVQIEYVHMLEALELAQTAMADAGLQECCSVAWNAVCAALEAK